ncbi:MAG: hypothetical protein AAF950_04080 [Pseudomonadota bacterium]
MSKLTLGLLLAPLLGFNLAFFLLHAPEALTSLMDCRHCNVSVVVKGSAMVFVLANLAGLPYAIGFSFLTGFPLYLIMMRCRLISWRWFGLAGLIIGIVMVIVLGAPDQSAYLTRLTTYQLRFLCLLGSVISALAFRLFVRRYLDDFKPPLV